VDFLGPVTPAFGLEDRMSHVILERMLASQHGL
jgi:hypothetical protein